MTNIEEFSLKKWLATQPLTRNSLRVSESPKVKKPKPFLHWVGGKREMIERYPEVIPSTFENYYEPFLGGGAMLFHLQPEVAFLNDSNAELISTYSGIRDSPEEVISLLADIKKRHSKEFYLSVRALDRTDHFSDFTDAEIAARMIFLNQAGFNGIYRVNQKGQFNVPIGSSLNRVINNSEAILLTSSFLKNHKFSSVDFEKATVTATSGDFVYLDPPYFPVSAYSDFTRYTKEQFSLDDQERVAEVFKKAAKAGAKVLLSNSNVPAIHELYKDYNISLISSSRSLSSDKNKRGNVEEVLVSNYEVKL